MGDIVQKIEELSMAFVMAEPSDLQTLGDLCKRFNEISAISLEEESREIARAATAASKLIEKIILNEVPDKDSAISAISETISAIQSIVSHQRDASEVRFPEELGLTIESVGEKDSDKTDQVKTEASASVDSEEQHERVRSETISSSSVISDVSLVGDFISESREHLHSAEVQLLTLENEPGNKDALNAVYRSFHTIKGVAGFLNLKEISELSHATEDLLDRARKGEVLLTGPVMDAVFAALDALKQMIADVELAITNGKPLSHTLPFHKLLSAIDSAISGIAGDADEDVHTSQKQGTQKTEPLSITDVEEKPCQEDSGVPQERGKSEENPDHVSSMDTATAKISLPEEKQTKLSPAVGLVKETIKIEAERLDRLVDMIGELVIAESMVSQDSEVLERDSTRISRNLSHLSKITRELQEIGMSLRMVPVRNIFERMARLARDLARKSGKKIEFTMSGENTEVDKSVVEKISDPLVHMIRNAVDHGIESSPEDRIKAGKPEVGHIELRAFHKGSNIFVEVEDDGRGLDKEAILKKAKERGIIKDDMHMSDQEIFNLIFVPGFSTAKVVTEVSGRGVGMDVVSRNVQALRGQVDVNSIPGKGTTFTIRLPLTLAIMDGIIVRVGREQYIIPTLSVAESVRPRNGEVSTIMGEAEMISIRGKLLPILRISELFNIEGAIDDPKSALIVVVEDEGRRIGLMVDDLVGHQQIVIKSLGGFFSKSLPGISGGTIMADGRVGLILDVASIIKMAFSR